MVIPVALLLLTFSSFGQSTTVIAPATQDDLCATWTDAGLASGSFKCSVDTCSSGWRGESTQFASDGTYRTVVTYGPSSSTCSPSSSTAFFTYTKYGRYTLGTGTFQTNWTNIQYTSDYYEVNALKDNSELTYTYNGTTRCDLSVLSLLNHETYGCKCNGTWVRGVARSLTLNTTTIGTGVEICTAINCPLGSLFPSAELYGNLKLYYASTVTKAKQLYLTLSSTSTDLVTGYAKNDSYVDLVDSGANCSSSIGSSTGGGGGGGGGNGASSHGPSVAITISLLVLLATAIVQ